MRKTGHVFASILKTTLPRGRVMRRIRIASSEGRGRSPCLPSLPTSYFRVHEQVRAERAHSDYHIDEGTQTGQARGPAPTNMRLFAVFVVRIPRAAPADAKS